LLAKPKEDHQLVSIINKTCVSQKSIPSTANKVAHDRQSKVINAKMRSCQDQHKDEIPAGNRKKIRTMKKPCEPEQFFFCEDHRTKNS